MVPCLYIKGGKISSNTYIANLAVVKKAELYATAGTMYQYVYGLGVATADELVFQFTDQAQMAQTAYRENYKMYVTSSAVVNKSVNVRIGASEADMHLQIIMDSRLPVQAPYLAYVTVPFMDL